MVQRKKKKKLILIITLSVLLVLLITGGVCAYLYLNTDLLKSNQTLFEKYIGQNLSIAKEFIKQKPEELIDVLNRNKYTSNTTIKATYTSGIGTTAETNQSNINNASINISSQVDKSNNYDYKNIRMAYNTEELAKVEYIQKDDLKGIRLDGIMQFTTIRSENIDKVAENLGIEQETLENMWMLTQELNLDEIFNFTEEEEQTILDKYSEVLEKNTSKDSFGKYNQSTISLNNTQAVADGYYLELTKEQYYSLLIELLNTISSDDIILSKIDNLENVAKQYGINSEKTYKEKFQEYINKYVEEIKSKNIGNEIFKISVYEQNGQTVKTIIETDEGSFTIDIYNENKSIKIDKIDTTETVQKRQLFTIERDVTSSKNNLNLEYIDYENGVEQQSVVLKNNKEMNNSDVQGSFEIIYELENSKIDIKSDEFIKIVNEFEEPLELNEENNITINDLNQEQTQRILTILSQNVENQMAKITEKITAEDINSMLKSLGFIKEDVIKTQAPVEVTETERNRFNSTLTLFIGEEMTADDAKRLLETVQANLKDAEITQDEDEK